MRILFYSNAPWASTGYGNPTRLMVQHLNNLGHPMAVACNYGLKGSKIEADNGVIFYPGGYDANSNDIVQAHADDFKADVIVSLYDVWPLKFMGLKTPWIAWTPIDHSPVPEHVLEALKPAKKVVAFAEFGQIELKKANVAADFIPLGVDTGVFKPGDKLEARRRLGLPEDVFIAGMIAANKSSPPHRKCIPQAAQAFAEFYKTHPDSMLYLHTEESGLHSGLRLKPLLKELGLLGTEAIKVCDQYQYLIGFPDPYMVDIYNAMDVLLSPSMSEGFGIPIVEAEACGTPVIATDFSSMPELVSGGWLVTEYERYWSIQGGWQVMPYVSAITECLVKAYESKSKADDYAERQYKARTHAELYDFEKVVAPMWSDYLRGLTL